VLLEDGLLKATDLEPASVPVDHVDFGRVIEWKTRLLKQAWQRFQSGSASSLQSPFDEFCARQADWLADFALFMALKDAHGGKSWLQWPQELLLRESEAIESASKPFHAAVGVYKFGQFLFFRQWSALKSYANDQGVRLIGDIPIFVAGDSADVWAHPELFLLNKERRPIVVAGVPPDYFSKTGQLWGNPLYNWEVMKQTNYAWWIARLRAMLQQVDLIRLDHFRGLEAFWEIPAGMPTAQVGRWVKGPGADLLETLRASLGGLPLIAEDLGVITPAVEELRLQFGLPGMRILQFAFGGAQEDRFLPHNYDHNTVVYTGTHDNETTCGW